MTSSAQLYLSKIQKLHANPQTHEKVKHLNTTMLNDIGNEIIQSQIVIPQHETKLKLKTIQNNHESEVSKIDWKYNEIKQKKKVLLEQLQAVQSMQSTIKMSLSTMNQSSVSTHMAKHSRFRSEFTEQEMTKIKQIYKNQKKFKRKIDSKIKKYQQELQLYRKEKEQQQKQKHRKLCMEKHEQREKYINQIDQRNKQRQQLLAQQEQKITELKSKQKLFQKLQDSFLKEKQLQSEQMKRKLQEHKKKREFSFDDMKRHQDQYMDRKRVKDQQREDNLKNFKNVNETKFPCLFLDKIKEQQERVELEGEERKQMVKNFAERKTAYAQQVRKNLHTKIKTMSESKLSAIKQTKTEQKWMNTPQKYQQGTKYMREINTKLAKMPRKVVLNTEESNKPKFKNYLTELKNQDPQKKKQAKQNNVSNVINHMSIISAKQNITSINLAKSVKAKLQLMSKLQNMQ